MLASGAITTLIVAWAPLHSPYRGREAHIALETAAALVATLAAYLIVGRFERRRRLDDLLLAVGLGVFAMTNLAFLALPAVFAAGPPGRFSVWAALAGRMVGAVIFAAAAFARPRRIRHRRAVALAVVLPAAMLAGAALVVALLGSRLPAGVEAHASGTDGPRLVGHPAVLAVQLVTMTLFAAASVGFVRHADREGDRFLQWLAVASAFAAFARLHYFLYPSLYTEWVSTGDAFRLLFYTLVLVAAVREIRGYWEAAAAAAVLEERRRLARDLHDGLAQELATIGRNLQWADTDEEAVERALAGTRRAMIASRRAIAALTEPVDGPLEAVLPRAVRDVAAREHTRVALAMQPHVDVTPEERDAIVRIACEAITNAARHGHARLVRVAVERGRGDALRLHITDVGDGFDPAARERAGFGLTSMRERAQAVGGTFRVSSAPGRGTEIEVEL